MSRVDWRGAPHGGGPALTAAVDRVHGPTGGPVIIPEGVRNLDRSFPIRRRRRVQGQRVAGEETRDGGAIVADGASLSVVTGSVIPTAKLDADYT